MTTVSSSVTSNRLNKGNTGAVLNCHPPSLDHRSCTSTASYELGLEAAGSVRESNRASEENPIWTLFM